MDDALSISHNEDGTYDVGVHITDVSYFVKPNTALDRDARKRATSVYLVQRAVPMLPPTLSEQLCSLVPGHDRLSLSVIFTLTKEAKVVKKWFGKTVIRSSAKLSYENVQDVIDGKILGGVPVAPEHEAADIAHDIKILHELASELHTQRFEQGALSLDSLRLSFKLNENGLPEDCWQRERTDANQLVEEVGYYFISICFIFIIWTQFMLLCNIAVAQHIAVHLPEQALLRRHDTPIERRLVSLLALKFDYLLLTSEQNALAERAERLGYNVDISSAGTMMRSFNTIQDPTARRLLQLLSFKATNRAKYFCAGMLDIAKYGHYALNTPLYTHFTSPIRRYADLLIHRQLDSIIQGGGKLVLLSSLFSLAH